MEKQPSVKKLFKLSFWITILLLLVATFAYEWLLLGTL